MPRLPTYDSKAQLTTQAPEVARTGAGETAKEISNAMFTVADMATKWKHTQDTIESNNALFDFEVGSRSLQIEATNKAYDPEKDAKWQDDYSARLDTLKNSCLQKINDPVTKNKMQIDLDHKQANSMIEIGSAIYKKQVDVGRTGVSNLMKLHQSDYVNAEGDPIEQANVRLMIEATANKAVEAGLWDQESGSKLVDQTIKEAQGFLRDRDSLRRVKEADFARAFEQATIEKEHSYLSTFLNGATETGVPLSREDIMLLLSRDAVEKKVSPEFTDAMIRLLKSPKSVNAITIDKDYTEIMKHINSGADEHAILIRIADMQSRGNLTPQDAKELQTYIKMIYSAEPQSVVHSRLKKAWWGLANTYEPINKEEGERIESAQAESLRHMSTTFINLITTGVDPVIASTEARRKEVLRLHPSATKSPDGIEVIDVHGVKKRITPIGDIVDPKPATKESAPQMKKIVRKENPEEQK